MKSLYKLSRRDLLARFMPETSWKDPCNRSLCNVSVQDLQKRCPGKIAVQDLYKRSLGKISVQAPSWQDFCMRCLVLCEPAQWKCTWTFHKRDFVSKNGRGHLCGHRFVRAAQSKCTWIFCKSHFAQKFTGKMPYATTGDIDTTSNEHPALTLTVRTPSVWPHCLGKKSRFWSIL